MSVLEEGLNEAGEWSRSEERIQAHYSSIMLHRRCPAAWYFRYQIGVGRPISDPAPYLFYGSWYGAIRTAEALVRGRKAGTLIQKPRRFKPVDDGPEFDMRTLTPKDVLEAAVAWWKEQCQDPAVPEDWQDKLGQDLPNRLKGGFLRWRDEFGAEAKNEEVLAVEMFWKRKLLRPEGDLLWNPMAGDAPNMVLIGFIDELYRDTERNIVVVRDNKSTSRMPNMSSLDDMLDSQLQLYAWGVTPALHNEGILPPRAISYDRALSKKPTEPKLNLNGTLSAQSKLYDKRTYLEWARTDTRPKTLEELQALAITNTSTAKKQNTWDDWPVEQQEMMAALLQPENAGRVYGKVGQFTATGAPKFGIYQVDQDLLRKLEAPDWRMMFHQRTLTPVNRQVINSHIRAAVDTVTDISTTIARTSQTFDPPRHLDKEGCRWCDYVNLCRAQMFGGADGIYDLREMGLRSKPVIETKEDGEKVEKPGPHILERGELRYRE